MRPKRSLASGLAVLGFCLLHAASGIDAAGGSDANGGSQPAGKGEAPARPAGTDRPSPMVLETMFAAADESLWDGPGWFSLPEYHDLGRDACDGVALRARYDKRSGTWGPGLEMSAHEGRDGQIEVKVRVIVNNRRHNHDKKVRVDLEVLDGGRTIRNGTIGPFEAEDDGDDVTRHTKLVFPDGVLRTDPMTRLRIVMTATDD